MKPLLFLLFSLPIGFYLNAHDQPSPEFQQITEEIGSKGNAYNPQQLLADVWGNVGITNDDYMTYFGQKAPGMKPEKFAPRQISLPDRYEYGSVFSQDGREFFFSTVHRGVAKTWYSKLENGVWTEPEVLLSDEQYSYNDPMLSPDEQRLYFITNRTISGKGEAKDYDIWYIERQISGWSEPQHIGEPLNTSANEYYISFSQEGDLYFASNREVTDQRKQNFDIYIYKPQGEVEKLNDAINTPSYEADVFVAPDASYLIFSANRPEGYGQGDLYISFKDEAGAWKEAVNMGPEINTAGHQLCPFVSADGKYFFFTSEQDIYWVDAGVLRKYEP